jgi:serine/threonine protein kinase
MIVKMLFILLLESVLYISYTKKTNFVLTADQVVHVFTTLLEFVMIMKEKGYCHSDIKPANTQLVKCEDHENAYILKVIDFGG